ncbi:hypothetical protein HG536_0H04260 [Torulaspora globosa]|uniref:Transcriptional protein SWT1 n=1 Tax=Torulaspora globosa TaxID=48254 RepID=A0A7G3ZNG4_9SACH|nr:uncharacterized protein HG536_0H04260 [Torulaspora globosa]QLL35050.1 hypothetical protein HG536_0H04260 [Torulaspora globosa]
MGLPSIYANDEDKVSVKGGANGRIIPKISKSIKEIANRPNNGKYTVSDIENLMLSRTNEFGRGDEDFPMLEMEDEDEIQLVSNILSQRRRSTSEDADSSVTRDALDLEIPAMMPTKVKSIFVADTNFLISHLSTLEALRQLASSFHHQIVIPNAAIRELDGLKNSSKMMKVDDNTEAIGFLARLANDWIYSHFANMDSGVMGQKLRQTINPNSIKDDAILDCCLFFKEKLNCFVVLLSNDKNLCMKALTEEILTVSFRNGMTAQLIASMTLNENLSLYGACPALDEQMIGTEEPGINSTDVAAKIYREITAAVIEAVCHVLANEYGDDIDLIGFQPGTLLDLKSVTKCIDRFWVSVFAEYFEGCKIKKNDWRNFPTALTASPTDIGCLKNFFKSWEEILNILYLKRNQADVANMHNMVQQWTGLIHGYH